MTQSRAKVSLEEFDRLFESVKNWGRWGPDDQLGTMNFITPDHVRAAAEGAPPDASNRRLARS